MLQGARRRTAWAKTPTISAPRFAARFRRPSERSSKSTDFPRQICAFDQRLNIPYRSGEVRSFGEYRRRETDFGLPGRLRGQQLFSQKCVILGFSWQPARRQRLLCATRLAEGVGFEPTTPFGEHALQACALDRSAIPPFVMRGGGRCVRAG